MRFTHSFFGTVSGLALALTLVPDAVATPINYVFSVTATSGPLSGTTAAGTFSYDSSSIVPGGGFNDNIGLLTALNFTWDGITYNQATANTGSLGFDGFGTLVGVAFGNDCSPGSCIVFSNRKEWSFSTFFTNFIPQDFIYARLGGTQVFHGTETLSQVVSQVVPEPSTWALLGAGLGGLALAAVRRRTRRA